MTRVERERLGRRGERIAAWYLRFKGWRILDTRVKNRAGEIDLVARRGRLVAFVEVKTRTRAADLELAIDDHRLKRVIAAVGALGHRYAGPGDDWRIDVILIAPGRWPVHRVNVSLS